MSRDLEAQPYSVDEQRVADWITGQGAPPDEWRSDPVGYLIAAFEFIRAQRNEMQRLARECLDRE